MIIVLEGLDCTGKDTILESLKQNLKDFYIVTTERPEDCSRIEKLRIKTDYRLLLNTAITNLPKITIFNRFWFSEQVYSIKRGYDALWDNDIMELSRILKKHPHIIFYFYNDDDEEMKKRMEKEKEDYLKVEERKELSNRYNQVIGQSMLNIHRINTNMSKEKVLEEVLKIIREEREKCIKENKN